MFQKSIALPFLILVAVFFGIYGVFGLQIAEGDFFKYYNLAFDMDPRRYSEVIAQQEELRHPSSTIGGPKHPLLFFLQIIGKPLTAIIGDWKIAAALTSCLFGALSVGLCFVFFRLLGIDASFAATGATLFGVSAAPLMNAFLSDSYVYALTTIVLAWAVSAYRMKHPGKGHIISVAAGVASFGVTVTNVFQNILGEAAARKPGSPWLTLFKGLFRYGLLVGAAVLIALILAFPSKMLWIATNPIDALKVVYWQQTKGETTGLATVFTSFFIYGFTAPDFTVVSLGGGAPMLDFRDWKYGPLGLISIAGWAVLFAASAILALRDRSSRKWMYLGLLIAIGVNLFLHGRYQFRGSVYLYAPHIVFNIFGFTAALLLVSQELAGRGRALILSCLGALIILTAATNLPIAWELATAFDDFVLQPGWEAALEASPPDQ